MSDPPSGGLRNNTQFNRSATPPQNFENKTQNIGSVNIPDQGSNQQTYSDGTLIFSENNLKIYKIS